MVGDSTSSPLAMGAWISNAAMLAVQASAATSSRQQYSMAPPRSPGPGVVPSHSGRCPGQRFSKNESAPTPSGQRRSVTPRPRTWGSITGAICT